jgi:hypothetical protein
MSSRSSRRAVAAIRYALVAMAMSPGFATSARAEIVFLTTGRTLNVRTHRFEDQKAILELRAGGQVLCDQSLIARIEPDEVPWPEPDAPVAVATLPVAPPSSGPAFPFAELIRPLAQQHGVDASLIRAVVATESAFEPRARSPKGAMGLMQLMPQTARQYSVTNPFDPSANLDAGIKHLKFLLDRYDIRVALAAYNAGEGAVRLHGGIPPFRETREYVERVLRRLEQYRVGGSDPTRPALASPTS